MGYEYPAGLISIAYSPERSENIKKIGKHKYDRIKPFISQMFQFKGSSDPSHFSFEINVGKSRNRQRTTLNLNAQSIFSRSRNSSFNFRVVLCRFRLFPTLISKIIWLGSGLPLNFEISV